MPGQQYDLKNTCAFISFRYQQHHFNPKSGKSFRFAFSLVVVFDRPKCTGAVLASVSPWQSFIARHDDDKTPSEFFFVLPPLSAPYDTSLKYVFLSVWGRKVGPPPLVVLV